VGQAPGSKVHATGIPFDDASGDRLRNWMGVSKSEFYDANQIAILPMGFCYPGKGKSGDLPPRKECAELWHDQLLAMMPNIELNSLTNTVKAWKNYWPNRLPLPHPSPRNNIWLKKNDWFEIEIIPSLQKQVQSLLKSSAL